MKKKHNIDSLFVLLLYFIFALLSLLLVLIGARVYKHIVREADTRSGMRSAVSYVANKIRAGDSENCLLTETREGIEVLVIREEYGEAVYETVIYYYNGMLCELLKAENERFIPEYGEKLIPLAGFSAVSENGFFTVTSVDPDGNSYVMYINGRT